MLLFCYFFLKDTSATISSWIVLLLCNNTHIKKALQKEIDSVIGARKASLEDRKSMPLMERVIREAIRFTPPAPLGVPHLTDSDIDLPNGFQIPKNTIVFTHLAHMLKDEQVWGPNANEFDPDRWLNATPDQLNSFRPFSLGPRECPGKMLGEFNLFITAVTLLRRFEFSHPKGEKFPTDPVYGLTYQPRPYKVAVKERKHP